jgi:hypothetical protein
LYHNTTILTAAATLRSYSTTSIGSIPADDYRIAVPSYDRALTLQRNTLSTLAAAGIDCSTRVDVFVAGEAEADTYARVLRPGTYNSIKVGRLGIGKQRDYILDYYGAGGRQATHACSHRLRQPNTVAAGIIDAITEYSFDAVSRSVMLELHQPQPSH